MGKEINLLDLYPRSKRPIEERGKLVTEEHRKVARQFGKEYFDGDRLYGYGGYSYHPRFWQETVKRFRDYYRLVEDASVLDVGCAKGFMLGDFKELMPNLTIAGIDISEYAIEQAIETVKPFLRVGDAKELPYEDNSFDLVISINTIHNLPRPRAVTAMREIERLSGGRAFVQVDSYRTPEQKEIFESWVLTAEFHDYPEGWIELFDEAGYTGDYDWTIIA